MSHDDNGSTSLVEISDRLRAEARQLKEAEVSLKDQLKQTQRGIRRIQTALRALGQSENTPRGRTAIKAYTTSEVVQLVAQELAHHKAPLLVSELRARVEARAKSEGRSLIGFHLRFEKALADAAFARTERPEGSVITSNRPEQ